MKKIRIIICSIILAFLINFLWTEWNIFLSSEEEKETIDVITALMKTVNISDLSTAEYIYNGIANVYDEKKTDKLECSIRYEASVKASIDFSKIEFAVNEELKEITVFLPKMEKKVYLKDENPLQFLPKDYKMDYSFARELCEADVEKEVSGTNELNKLAEENLKNTIIALLTPITKEEYQIKWEVESDE